MGKDEGHKRLKKEKKEEKKKKKKEKKAKKKSKSLDKHHEKTTSSTGNKAPDSTDSDVSDSDNSSTNNRGQDQANASASQGKSPSGPVDPQLQMHLANRQLALKQQQEKQQQLMIRQQQTGKELSAAAAEKLLNERSAQQSKKRGARAGSITPTKLSAVDLAERQRRNAARFANVAPTPSGTGGGVVAAVGGTAAGAAKGRKRKLQQQQQQQQQQQRASWSEGGAVGDDDWSSNNEGAAAVKGTSKALEKSYFRLTEAPDPSVVRPLKYLKKSLEHVKRRYAADEEYAWACEQLKAIRQDVTVQHIQDELTVDAYQTHARIALESGDLNEYNQCQSRLSDLAAVEGLTVAQDEFTAYRLLYSLYRGAKEDVYKWLSTLSERQRRQPAVRHAMGVIRSEASSDYHTFFRLYDSAPHMSAFLMDYLVDRMRRAAFERMVRAYMPSLPLSFIATTLSFSSADEAANFIVKHGGVLRRRGEGEGEGETFLDVKESRAVDALAASTAVAASRTGGMRRVVARR